MNQKKNNKLLIIAIIVVVILIIGIGVAYALLATDVFKSNKELFFKYITQISDEKKGFISTDVTQYFDKKKETPYETNGKISFNIESSANQDDAKNINNCNISIKGKVDNANEKNNEEISVNYSEEVKLPFIFQKVGDIVGIQTDYIGNKYIGTEINKLEDLQTTNSTYSSTNNSNTSNIEDVQISEEQIKYIKDTYFKVLEQELKDSNFTMTKTDNDKTYQLNLSGEEVKNVLIKLLETLKNDQVTLDKINEYIKCQSLISEIDADDIEKDIEELNDKDFDNENLQITIHVSNKQLSKIDISISDVNITIEKQESGNSKQYNISADINTNDQNVKVYLNAKYSGLQSLQTITEDYELGIQTDSSSYVYYYNNEVNFVGSVNIDDFDNDNILVLSNYENEQVENLKIAILERMVEVNKQQMEKLGLTEDQNPLQYALPISELLTSQYNSFDQMSPSMNEAEAETFNSKFEMYESSNLKGPTVKGLLSTIENNNNKEDADNKIEEINFNGQEYEPTEQNITLIKSEIELEAEYRVEFEKNENTGIIYRAVINKK